MTYEQRLLAGYSHIIECHAETCVKRIARKTFHHLQKCKRESGMMQSEPDSGLENIWDEVCVQVQREHSAFWDLYEEYILTSITRFLETDCTTAEKQMIWLQTDACFNWSYCEAEEEADLKDHFDNNNFPNDYALEDVATYILDEVLRMAEEYHNQRIEKYLN